MWGSYSDIIALEKKMNEETAELSRDITNVGGRLNRLVEISNNRRDELNGMHDSIKALKEENEKLKLILEKLQKKLGIDDIELEL